MKHASRLLLIFALAAAAVSGLPISSYSGGRDIGRPVALHASAPGGPAPNSWVGGGAAIGCGFGIRYAILGGGNPIWLGGTFIMCLIATVDGLNS